jgi:predicted dehydrogenase
MPGRTKKPLTKKTEKRKVRYAVVGLGHIAQVAVLPGFKQARNAELAALVSGDATKLQKLGRKYKVEALFNYGEYQDLLRSGTIDAVYISLPNHLHRDYCVQAAQAGVHILCEKPLAVTEGDCEAMIQAAEDHQVYLMTAYRLHFDLATLTAVAEGQNGALGELRFLNAALSHAVPDPRNIRRTPRLQGGGPLYDLGIYCINAARMLFKAEPAEVAALMHADDRDRSVGVETSLAGLLRFPGGELATFECSNDSAELSEFTLVGSKGQVRIDDAFEYEKRRILNFKWRNRKRTMRLPRHDQFGAELLYFSNCILQKRPPQPSGWEGLADVRVIRALHQAAQTGKVVALSPFSPPQRPQPGQDIELPPPGKAPTVKANPPSGESKS